MSRPGPAADGVLAHDLHLEALARGPNRRVVEQDLVRLGKLLEAHCRRHRIAGDDEVRPVAHLANLGHHLAGRDAHPETERRLVTSARHILHCFGHRQAAEGRP
jgi:hypothetical protein